MEPLRGRHGRRRARSAGRGRLSPFDPTVVIVAYRSGAHLPACLTALRADAPRRVLVVDNACPDRCADGLRASFPDVEVLRLPRNDGFAAGVNAALRVLGSDADVVLLNPDTEPEPGWIAALGRAFEKEADAGICGALILDGAGAAPDAYQAQLLALRGLPVPAPDDPPLDVGTALGAALGIRGDVIARLGGLDPQFFLYGEETDYCRRARDAGFRVLLAPAARVRHVGEASSRSSFRTAWLRSRNDALEFLKRPNVRPSVRVVDLLLRQVRAGAADLVAGRLATASLRAATLPAVLLRLGDVRRSLAAEARGPAYL